MNTRRAIAVLGVAALGASIATTAVADDGEKVMKSLSQEGGTSVTAPGNSGSAPGRDKGQAPTNPNVQIPEAEHAFIAYMKFYTDAQRSNGDVYSVTDTEDGTPDNALTYYDVEGNIVDTREYAKPLVGVYMYGPVETVEGVGFVGHGLRDAYASISLDDGVTWKSTNLSESADKASSDVIRKDVKLFKDLDGEYAGDVINIVHAVAGPNVLVAWPSRYCQEGSPSYSLDNPEATQEQLDRRAAIADYLGIDLTAASADDLYLIDMYGVGGSQGSIDYSDDKFEPNQAVGEVPFSCLWTARGELVQGDDPRTEDATELSFMRWFKAERLTSGVRDVNRIETQCNAAGCAITWQEDPEGLRGGSGEGPGEGWSGAVANSGTDIWYSYIDAQNFDVVQDPADDTGATPMTLLAYEAAAAAVDADITQQPKPFVPMAMPMRLTDNEKCNTTNPKPYCDGSAIDNPDSDIDPLLYGLKDMCVATIEVETGQDNELTAVCVDDTGLPNIGNTAATRARLGLYSYTSEDPLADEGGVRAEGTEDMDAFTVIVAEEDKGLGKFGYKVDADGVFVLDADGYAEECTIVKGEDADPSCQPFDEGKNLTYHSFSMSLTDAVGGTEKNPANVEDTLVENLTHHWNQLNQPEVNWKTGDFYPVMNTADLWGFGDYDFDIWNTEIARRGSLLAQDIDAVGKDGLFAFPTWKQGTMNQGGPADVLARRIVVKNWKVKDGNPYAYTNMECDGEMLYTDGENPYFPDGLCTATPINLSATVPDTAVETDTGNTDGILPVLTEGEGDFLISTVNPILEGKILDDGDDNTTDSNTTKVLTWHSCPAAFDSVSGIETVTCDEDSRTDSDSTLADQTWYNPLEVAKGHRGFLDGDMVMLLYAWSPNYRLNTKGNDRYDLYIRRSFDAGQTWTTTPGGGEKDSEGVAYGGDGTVTCETYRSEVTGDSEQVDEPRACSSYEAGAAEQPRNVTQHSSMRTTTLDPRYAMTGSPYGVSIESELFGITPPNYMVGDEVDGEDIRDASRFFIVYETGDNTTAAEGEPEPLDLFYSRAVNYGDDYVVWDDDAELDGESDLCYPSNPHDDIDPDTGVAEELIGSGFCNEFDQMESGTPGLEASESSLQANPGGEFLYGAWTQIMITEEEIGKSGKTRVTVEESDAMARRVWWIDGFTSDEFDWQFGQGTGDGVPAN